MWHYSCSQPWQQLNTSTKYLSILRTSSLDAVVDFFSSLPPSPPKSLLSFIRNVVHEWEPASTTQRRVGRGRGGSGEWLQVSLTSNTYSYILKSAQGTSQLRWWIEWAGTSKLDRRWSNRYTSTTSSSGHPIRIPGHSWDQVRQLRQLLLSLPLHSQLWRTSRFGSTECTNWLISFGATLLVDRE